MDHGRKIGKTDIPFSWTKRPSPPSSLCEKTSAIEETVTEDRRLVNWRNWLSNRKKHYQYLANSSHSQRDHQDLLIINDADGYREKVEMKTLIEYAGNLGPGKNDKYRGNPAFWIIPESLSNHGNLDWPVIPMTLTRKQLNVQPDIERIVLPELIKQEKGLPIASGHKSLWNRSEYLSNRKMELSREIEFFELKEPEVTKLSVKGRGFVQGRTKQLAEIATVTIKEPEVIEPVENADSQSNVAEHDDIIIMMIQNREIRFDQNARCDKVVNGKHSEYFLWPLIFNCTNLVTVEREICLENRSNYMITYRWRYESSVSSFASPLPQKSPFFFNKNDGLVLPREIVRLPVRFCSQVPRTVTEFWTLTTNPQASCESLTFKFWGFTILPRDVHSSTSKSVPKDGCHKKLIDLHLDRCIRDTKIDDTLRSVLDNIQRNHPPSVLYNSLFVESEIFRSINPSHFSHYGLTRQLKAIYEEVTGNPASSYDLSLMNLRRVLLGIKDLEMRNDAMTRFNDLCWNSLHPSLYEPVGNAKRTVVYNLLCCFANKFDVESNHVTSRCFQMEISSMKISREAPDNASRSNSISGISQVSSNLRKKTIKLSHPVKSKNTSRTSITSISTDNRENTDSISEKNMTKKCFLYKEIFHVRIREILYDTINAICGAIDTIDNFNLRE